MGYTHYMRTNNWNKQDEKGWEKALPKIRKILKRYNNIIQREYNDERKPLCTKKQIRFNGIGEEGHETFCLQNQQEQNEYASDTSFCFCKTARKDYDIVVCEVLLVLNYYCPHLSIDSDGFSGYLAAKPELDESWPEAMENVKEHYNITYHSEVVNERAPYCDMLPIFDN